ncbi:hypothetical protein FZEAL_6078 [Fusarium zealandicum]|uniref:Uncharacterized protein n=1 Tax=Fusarium zealandicum TaxID=1053134 RepID=A0A8H4UJ93_9HYPO|nr:hypothetical protein FZEAL_6078 [Fusarium zealandicum]
MATPEKPRRRFAPEPIETTFETFRSKTGKQKQVLQQNQKDEPQTPRTMGPRPEPTPEPSPRSPSPVPHELRSKRRFAPQLIESSRRSRRVGDSAPATKPADKTDITPYTKNIYTATKHRGRRRDDSHDGEESPVHRVRRRESEDEGVVSYLLELAAKEAERQMQEDALAAFPNSHAREGGVDHFYFRESSGSDNSPESTSPVHHHHGHPVGHHHPARRQSSDNNLGWWHKHAQEHAEQVQQEQHHDDPMVIDEAGQKPGEMATLAEEPTEGAAPKQGDDTVMRTDTADLDKMDLTLPPDPMWTTSNNHHAPPAGRERSSPGPIGETYMPLLESDSYLTVEHSDKGASPASASPSRHIGESPMPYIPSGPTDRSADVPYAKSSQIPPDTGGFRSQARPFGRPFGGFGHRSPAPPSQKKAVTPPMLGKELVFRRCPSPKFTKLEPDHPFADRHLQEKYRDASGEKGLWRGYCFRTDENGGYLVPADLHAPPMLATPRPAATPGAASHIGSPTLTDEPGSINGANGQNNGTRARNAHAKGLHMLHGINERLQQEKAHVEREDKIANEFDDSFVTQVYNYLSLGYPAMARAYDEELSRISLMSLGDLEQDDEKQLAQGHLVEVDDSPREKRCPRWKALSSYVKEWARQHPNLDSMDPVGWGVRERRGSWAV